MNEPALDQLVNTLLLGTQNGTVRWQEATGDGNSFVTRRASGTITIMRRTGIAGALGSEVTLSVRDSLGAIITEIESPTPTSALQGGPSAASRHLIQLFEKVRAKHSGDHAALQRLIADFAQPGGSRS